MLRPKFLLALLLAVVATESVAQPVAPEPLFRRVVPPGDDHTGPLIDIQIEPQPEPEEPPEREPEIDQPVEPDSSSLWFWSRVPPQFANAEFDAVRRFELALEALSSAAEARAVRVTSLAALAEIAAEHGPTILANTADTAVSPAFVLAVIAVESAGRADAVSHAGAQGLMQLIPATADRFGVRDPFDPAQNIAGGVAYLDWLLDKFAGDPILALAGYNAGEGAVMRSGGVPNYDETRDYVPKVISSWDLARGLCLRPPETVFDPCIFANMAGG